MCYPPDKAPKYGELIFAPNENGTIVEGALAEYRCSTGYNIMGPSKKICMEDGWWKPRDKVFCVKDI